MEEIPQSSDRPQRHQEIASPDDTDIRLGCDDNELNKPVRTGSESPGSLLPFCITLWLSPLELTGGTPQSGLGHAYLIRSTTGNAVPIQFPIFFPLIIIMVCITSGSTLLT
jgi:hypothetical protein